MRIDREGFPTIIITFTVLSALVNVFIWVLDIHIVFDILFAIAALVFWVFFIMFFRHPKRTCNAAENQIVAPADGKVVVIEETTEEEYFKDKRIQVSIFMSPLNVHVNWFPTSGTVTYYKYHKGKFLVAWHPKSSTLNERTTTVIKRADGTEILVRQIAGAVARRIVNYVTINDKAEVGKQFGFIKFGSRLDVFFPVGTDIKVELEQMVKGTNTVLANL